MITTRMHESDVFSPAELARRRAGESWAGAPNDDILTDLNELAKTVTERSSGIYGALPPGTGKSRLTWRAYQTEAGSEIWQGKVGGVPAFLIETRPILGRPEPTALLFTSVPEGDPTVLLGQFLTLEGAQVRARRLLRA